MYRYNIHYCDKCHLGIFNGFTPVCGEGESFDIMIIGEAPGVTEKKKGVPFVGKSGKLLRKHLRKYNLEQHSYITNVVKCRPPANRKPRPDEVNMCKGYLIREIKRYKPKFIILLGATAINFIYPNAYVKNKAGKFYKIGNTYVGCFYHPSYVLQNNDKLEDFDKFLYNCSKIYSHINPYYVNNIGNERIKKRRI